jgi:hypothetical protein
MQPLETLLASWGQAETLPHVAPGWEASAASLCGAEELPLDPERLIQARAYAGLDPAFDSHLQVTAQRIQQDPDIRLFFWHVYRRAYLEPDVVDFSSWPELVKPLGGLARVFYLIVALASQPLMQHRHREMGIDDEVTRATAHDVVEKTLRSALAHPEQPGIAPRELTWFQHHVGATVFTIGRLQYRFRPFRGDLIVYRHRTTGHCVALANDGVEFTAQGYRLTTTQGASPAPDWRASLEVASGLVTGHPISPLGFALKKRVHLAVLEWEQVLANGDRCFEMHIPGGGGLRLEACRDSLLRVIDFHRRHFAEPLPRAFSCITWFLGPHMREILPSEANIMKFQRAGYRFPVPSSGRDGFPFIFGRTELPQRNEIPDTSLARGIFDFVRAGGNWRSGGMFLLREHAETFGQTIPQDSVLNQEEGSSLSRNPAEPPPARLEDPPRS